MPPTSTARVARPGAASRRERARGAVVPPQRGGVVGSQRDARERLLRAALARFDADGTLATTLDEIRREAGVSVGALYHHFPDKASLASALYADRLADFQDGFVAVLRAHPDAQEGVRAGVRFYLRWVGANRASAAFLLGWRPADAALRDQNRRFFAEAMSWWRTHARYGVLRELPFDVIHALWLGPAQEYARHWVAGRARRVPATVSAELADAAWHTLKEDR